MVLDCQGGRHSGGEQIILLLLLFLILLRILLCIPLLLLVLLRIPLLYLSRKKDSETSFVLLNIVPWPGAWGVVSTARARRGSSSTATIMVDD